MDSKQVENIEDENIQVTNEVEVTDENVQETETDDNETETPKAAPVVEKGKPHAKKFGRNWKKYSRFSYQVSEQRDNSGERRFVKYPVVGHFTNAKTGKVSFDVIAHCINECDAEMLQATLNMAIGVSRVVTKFEHGPDNSGQPIKVEEAAEKLSRHFSGK